MTQDNLCQVAILAGGMGSRLKSRTGDLPKPMATINGKPVLEHQINLCAKHGFTKIALLIHYQSDQISRYFGDGSKYGVELAYVIENEARGTAGALLDALDVMGQRFIVLYGDTYADVDLKAFWDFDSKRKSAGTLLLHPNDHPQDSDLMEVNMDGVLIKVHPYPHSELDDHPNLVNAALYILEKESLISIIPNDRKSDLAKHTFPGLLASEKVLYTYVTPEYIKDMGTPERLDKVERDINEGLPERLSERNPRFAVFLDRDGTINEEVNHLKSPDQLALLKGVPEAIGRFNRAGILAIGVTNQPVLARGDVTPDGLNQIHARLDTLLGRSGSYLDRMYICPHHPDRGFMGEVAELKINCTCRKPLTGLIDQAIKDLNISRRNSWMVGDSTADILAGSRAGLRTILVNTGHAGRDHKYDIKPDYIASDLADAAEWILSGHAKTVSKLMSIALSAESSRIILVGGLSRSGKSTVANVLIEIFLMMGKIAHVLPLDGWLKPACDRQEGGGVLNRYCMDTIAFNAELVRSSSCRVNIKYAQYDRKIKQIQSYKDVSIGPDDIVIFEGVPALLDDRLLGIANSSIFVGVDDHIRLQRLRNEYSWRGEDSFTVAEKIASREGDEVFAIKQAASRAQFHINL
jgi:histidinol-phosphate phosphatase family protein